MATERLPGSPLANHFGVLRQDRPSPTESRQIPGLGPLQLGALAHEESMVFLSARFVQLPGGNSLNFRTWPVECLASGRALTMHAALAHPEGEREIHTCPCLAAYHPAGCTWRLFGAGDRKFGTRGHRHDCDCVGHH